MRPNVTLITLQFENQPKFTIECGYHPTKKHTELIFTIGDQSVRMRAHNMFNYLKTVKYKYKDEVLASNAEIAATQRPYSYTDQRGSQIFVK